MIQFSIVCLHVPTCETEEIFLNFLSMIVCFLSRLISDISLCPIRNNIVLLVDRVWLLRRSWSWLSRSWKCTCPSGWCWRPWNMSFSWSPEHDWCSPSVLFSEELCPPSLRWSLLLLCWLPGKSIKSPACLFTSSLLPVGESFCNSTPWNNVFRDIFCSSFSFTKSSSSNVGRLLTLESLLCRLRFDDSPSVSDIILFLFSLTSNLRTRSSMWLDSIFLPLTFALPTYMTS